MALNSIFGAGFLIIAPSREMSKDCTEGTSLVEVWLATFFFLLFMGRSGMAAYL